NFRSCHADNESSAPREPNIDFRLILSSRTPETIAPSNVVAGPRRILCRARSGSTLQDKEGEFSVPTTLHAHCFLRRLPVSITRRPAWGPDGYIPSLYPARRQRPFRSQRPDGGHVAD